MNKATLESLMMDKALGELEPEVEALLGGYLEDHPDAAREFSRIDRTVALARRVLERDGNLPLPAFPVQRLRHQARLLSFWRGVRVAAGAAACIVLGLAIGHSYLAEAPISPNAGTLSPTLASAASASTPTLAASTTFWTTAVSERQSRLTEPSQGAAVVWTSVFTPPQLRDRGDDTLN